MRDDARKGETHTHAHPSKYTIRGERERDQKTQLDSRREKLGQRPTLSLRDCEKSHTRNKAHRTSERGNVSLSAGWLRNRDYAGAPPRSEIALASREFMKLEITPRVEKCRLFLFSLSLSLPRRLRLYAIVEGASCEIVRRGDWRVRRLRSRCSLCTLES